MTTLTVPSRLSRSDMKLIRDRFTENQFNIRRDRNAVCASATGNSILAHRLVATVNGMIDDRVIGNQAAK